jgi:hypothetical protein
LSGTVKVAAAEKIVGPRQLRPRSAFWQNRPTIA